jgi:NADPH:quinone reductase-like Zn-dependent oxidoreductase
MKAIVQNRYGSADVLRLTEIEKPVVGAGEVLVHVSAAGVDPGVWHLMTGRPYLIRVMGYGLRAPKWRVRGRDLAGRVEAVGAKVTRFKAGDDVFGTSEGSFADYTSAREDRLGPKPANLSFEQAATVPISAQTALQALRDAGQVRPGQRVLIIGAAGGVGSFAVQIAKAFGAHVTGVCSGAKADLVRSIGADDVIDYTREDLADGTRRFDLIVDTAGNRSLSHLRRALAPRGTLVLVGGEGGGPWLGMLSRMIQTSVLARFVKRHKLRVLSSKESKEDLQVLRELIETGKVTPVIDRTYPLSDVPAAIRYLEQGHARGKVVITVRAGR